jgi:hypothetical protein
MKRLKKREMRRSLRTEFLKPMKEIPMSLESKYLERKTTTNMATRKSQRTRPELSAPVHSSPENM